MPVGPLSPNYLRVFFVRSRFVAIAEASVCGLVEITEGVHARRYVRKRFEREPSVPLIDIQTQAMTLWREVEDVFDCNVILDIMWI